MAGFSEDVMRVIRVAAPTVGGLLGSAIPLPGVGTAIGIGAANLAVEALGKALGVPATPEAINDRIQTEVDEIKQLTQSDGEKAFLRDEALHAKVKGAELVALKEIEANFQVATQRLHNENTADARLRFAGKNDIGQIATIVAVILMVCGVFGAVMVGFAEVKDPLSNMMIGIIIGHVASWMGNLVNYYLGSSSGSKRSMDSLRSIAETK